MVLIAGGQCRPRDADCLVSAELYDPSARTFTATGSMIAPRRLHTATLLPDGRVLIVGGVSNGADTGTLARAELYDPEVGTFTSTGSMTVARQGHTATLLPNGTVLVVGGSSTSGYDALASVELYDPSAGTFAAIGCMAVARMAQTTTLLPDGRVLVAGGADANQTVLSSAELSE
jgi:hypothetical protein